MARFSTSVMSYRPENQNLSAYVDPRGQTIPGAQSTR
jgi:hypothetical protein